MASPTTIQHRLSSTSPNNQDNLSTIHLANGDGNFQRTRHLNMRYHYIRQAIKERFIILRYIATEDHTTDILTKIRTSAKQFFKFRARLMSCIDSKTGL